MGDRFLAIVLYLSLKSWRTNQENPGIVPKRPWARENLGEQIKETQTLYLNAVRARENLGEQIKEIKALYLNAVRARENLGEQIKETKALCLTAIKSRNPRRTGKTTEKITPGNPPFPRSFGR